MLKKIKDRKHKVIRGLASECEVLEQQISDSISEILRLVDSINIDLEDELSDIPNQNKSLKVEENEKQAEAS
jgi:hypothetical protein